MDGTVSVSEACQFLSLRPTTIYRLMGDGELAFCKFGRARRIPRRALVRYAARQMRGGYQKAIGE